MRTFEYLKPTSLKEALELLEHHGERAKLVAGGTDVMVLWKKRAISPEYLISLRNVPELHFITYDGGLKIGAATPLRTIELSPEVREHFPVVTDAVSNLGSVQVRNSGTMGGNLCNAAPSADSAPPMLVLGAEVAISSPAGERCVPITEFFEGPSKTVVGPREIVTHFSIPKPQPNAGAAYWKHTRRKAMDLPILGVACLISFQDDMKTCRAASIALGVAAPTPIRAHKAEAFLAGKLVDEAVLDEAGAIAASEGSPRTTIRGSAWYRSEMIRVLVKRTGLMCRDRAKGAAVK